MARNKEINAIKFTTS